MELRIFQIIIPILAIVVIVFQFINLKSDKATILEVFIIALFWTILSIISLFPDFISNKLASLLGIKDNINAIIFAAIGFVFYFQYQLYKILKRQDKILTDFIRKDALNNAKENITPK